MIVFIFYRVVVVVIKFLLEKFMFKFKGKGFFVYDMYYVKYLMF